MHVLLAVMAAAPVDMLAHKIPLAEAEIFGRTLCDAKR